jgi:hypothetical protein
VPIGIGSDTLTVHPPGTTEITGRVKTCNGGMVDNDSTGEDWTCLNGCGWGIVVGSAVKLHL